MIRFLSILFFIQFGLIQAQAFSSFTSAGSQSQFVPVVFSGGSRTFFISRPGIHEDREWLAHGIVSVTAIGNGWGSGGSGLRIDNFTSGFETNPSSPTIGFVGRVVAGTANNDVVVYLRGGTTYYTDGTVSSNTGSYSDAAGLNLSTVSINDPMYRLPKGIYYGTLDINANTSNFTVTGTGNTGIGTSAPQYKLDVNGKSSFADNMRVNAKIEAKEIKVTLTPTADFVFENDYNLPRLEDIEKHIKEKKHLPEISSAKEMEKEGVNVGKFQIKLLQKIEELTLYTIEQNKQLKNLQISNTELMDEVAALKKQITR